MPESILVVGGAGYIGSHMVKQLRRAGFAVAVADDLSSGHRKAVGDAPLHVGDIGDAAFVDAVLGDTRPAAVMHFASFIQVGESVADPAKYYRNNVTATQTLLDGMRAHGVSRSIFSSTAATYGVPEIVPVREDSPQLPINPYGMSKLMTEHMLRDVAAAHPLNFAALRYFNVAGADPQGRSGQSTAGATHLIKVAVEAATGKRDGVSVFGTDFATRDGTGVRDYIHVSDLAAAHVDALDLLIAEPGKSHFLNAGYGRGYSVLEVLDAVDRVTNVRIERRLEGRRAGDPDELVSDNRAILAALPWRPRHDDLDRIVADPLAWERKLAERA